MCFKITFATLFFVIFFTNDAFSFALGQTAKRNNYPIIGIMSQDMIYFEKYYPGMYESFISGSNVKYIESAGARIVPIPIGKNESYYEELMSKINGVVFPGNPVFSNQGVNNADGESTKITGVNHADGEPINITGENPLEYAKAEKKIYKIAKKLNDNNNYFPIFGICAGMMIMPNLESNSHAYLSYCQSMNEPLPLEFAEGYEKSRMFGNVPDDMKNILKKENVTQNFHTMCITDEGLARVNVSDKFHILSYNYDDNNEKFISSWEHVKYPFYGVQFHPEVNSFEWLKGKNIPHSHNAIKASRYFADFFVNEARKNFQHFSSKKEEDEVLIYKYSPIFTGLIGLEYQQTYMFKKNH